MQLAIWIHELLDPAGKPRVGGVQTYVFELAQVARQAGWSPHFVAAHQDVAAQRGAVPTHCLGTPVTALLPNEWKRGLGGPHPQVRRWRTASDCVHVVANAHAAPRRLASRAIGIQHGIYWDRPVSRKGIARRVPRRAALSWRAHRGAAAVRQYRKLVCVDLAYPTMAACLQAPLDWNRIAYVPNFAPDSPPPDRRPQHLKRIVFSRRLEVHRGTRLLSEALTSLGARLSGYRVEIYGNGPEDGFLRRHLASLPVEVRYDVLPFERRMEAFGPDALVVIPSLSTEGTSLTCIEAWSRGAPVIATGVGGLANLVLDRHNGLLIRPLSGDLATAIERCLEGSVDVTRMRLRGRETFDSTFTRERWARQWLHVLEECRGHRSPAAGKTLPDEAREAA